MRTKIYVSAFSETPKNYIGCRTVEETIHMFKICSKWGIDVEELVLNLDSPKDIEKYVRIINSLDFGNAIGAIDCDNMKFRLVNLTNPYIYKVISKNHWKIIGGDVI